MKRLFVVVLAFSVLGAATAFATTPPATWNPNQGVLTACYDSSGNLTSCSGGGGATSSFTPIAPSVSLTATSTSSNVLFTAGGTVLEVYDGGTNPINVVLGTSSAVTASATSTPVPAGATLPFAIGSNTYIAVYAATGSNAVTVTSGTGSGYAIGGGSSALPSGAATAANQTNTQAAAGSSSSVATGVQGVSGGVPVPVAGPTPDGSAAAYPPFLIAGTVDGTATGTIENWLVDATGSGLIHGAITSADGGLTTVGFFADQCGAYTVSCSVDGRLAAIEKQAESTAPTPVNGQVSNASSAVATGSTNVPVVAYLYGYNGTTWDQFQVDASKNLKINVAAGTIAGAETQGSAVTGGMTRTGYRAATATPTAVTDGQAVDPQATKDGRTVNKPYSIPELDVRNAGSSTSTTAITIASASGSASLNEYLTGLQCSNTSSTNVIVTLSDTASSVYLVPANGATNVSFLTPLKGTANTAMTATPGGSGATTIYCNGQSYNAP